MNSQPISTFFPNPQPVAPPVDVEIEAIVALEPLVESEPAESGSIEADLIEAHPVESHLALPAHNDLARDDMAFDVLILRDEQFRPRGTRFKVLAPPVEAIPAAPVVRPSRRAQAAQTPVHSPRRWPGRLPLAAVALLGLSSAALAGRHQLVAIAPPTASLFSAIGLPANTLGIELRHVKARVHEANGETYLIVEGQISNPQKTRRKVGELQLLLQDSSGREIYRWSAAAPVGRLEGGESADFKTRLASPLREAADVLVRFASRG